MKLKTAIAEFLIAIEADGLASSTIRWYRSLLSRFLSVVGNDRLTAIQTGGIRQFVILIRKDYREDTAAAHLRALHKFFKWCSDEYDIKNPMRNIRYPSVKKQHHPKPVAADDIAKIFAATEKQSAALGQRDRAIIALLADSGIRAGELVSILMVNIDMDRRRVVVTGKGDKSRVVPFSEFTARLIQKWMNQRGACPYLFYNMRTMDGLTVSGLQQIMKRLKKRAGVTGRVNPHAFRHAFARDYLKNGGDLVTLRRILGHADLEVTANFYAVFTHDEMSDSHEKFTPIKNLNLDERNGGE